MICPVKLSNEVSAFGGVVERVPMISAVWQALRRFWSQSSNDAVWEFHCLCAFGGRETFFDQKP